MPIAANERLRAGPTNEIPVAVDEHGVGWEPQAGQGALGSQALSF